MVSAPYLTSLQTLAEMAEKPAAALDGLAETLLRLRYGGKRARVQARAALLRALVAAYLDASPSLVTSLLRRQSSLDDRAEARDFVRGKLNGATAEVEGLDTDPVAASDRVPKGAAKRDAASQRLADEAKVAAADEMKADMQAAREEKKLDAAVDKAA